MTGKPKRQGEVGLGAGRVEVPGGAGNAPERAARPFLGAIFARSDDPLAWSVSVFSWCGYRVGVHWILVFWVFFQLLLALPFARIGPQQVALGVGATLLVMFTRELSRLFLASRVGCEGEYVPMWPLGATVGPTLPRALAPRVLVALAPTILTAGLSLVLGATLYALGAKTTLLLFNPFDVKAVTVSVIGLPLVGIVVWWLYFATIVVGGLNLLPMAPLDGGRILEAFVAHRKGPGARHAVGLVGLFTAGIVTVVGLVADQAIPIAVGLFGSLASWFELRRAEFVARPAQESLGLPPAWLDDGEVQDAPAFAEEIPEMERPGGTRTEHDERAVLDAILTKISASGLASLTDEEKKVLQRATDRLKQG